MSYLPTETELAALGVQLAHDGFGPHEPQLRRVAALAQAAGVSAGLADLVVDPSADEALRARAYSKLILQWGRRRAAVDQQLAELLEAWIAHDDLRHGDPSTAELWESRAHLDRQRLTAATQRCS